MDIESPEHMISENNKSLINYIVYGEKESGKSTFISQLTSSSKIQTKFKKLNEIQTCNELLNIFELSSLEFLNKNINFFRGKKNILIILYESLRQTKSKILEAVDEIKKLDFVEKFFLIKNNFHSKIRKNSKEEEFALSIGFKFCEMENLNDFQANERINQLIEEIVSSFMNESEDHFDIEKRDSTNSNSNKKIRKVFKITKVPKTRKKLKNVEGRKNRLKTKVKNIVNKKNVRKINQVENETSMNSLISISKKAFEFIKSKDKTNGQNVTKYIQQHINRNQVNISFKNIQRRVYDAINVMTAIGLISKQKNNLIFEGSFQIYESNTLEKIKMLKQNISDLKTKINKNQHVLMQYTAKNYLCRKLIEDNMNNPSRRLYPDKLNYPFLLIKLGSDACFTIKEDDSNSRVCIFSDKNFTIIKDEDIMKELLKNDSKIKLKLKFCSAELNSYLQNHNLVNKYFNNLSNFNSNNFYLNDSSHPFSNHTLKKSSIHSNESDAFQRQNLDVFKENFHQQPKKSMDSEINLDCFEKVDMQFNMIPESTLLGQSLQETNFGSKLFENN